MVSFLVESEYFVIRAFRIERSEFFIKEVQRFVQPVRLFLLNDRHALAGIEEH